MDNDKTNKSLNTTTKSAHTKKVSLKRSSQKNTLWIVVIAAIVVLAILLALLFGGKPARSESYKDSSGAAGLSATIEYKCDKQPCPYDFNVYLFNNSGQQVSVMRPDKDGKVNAALQEGDYTMIIGKQFGKEKIFPQEPLVLKNGKTLELRLHY